jgi:hypothetical protein
MTDKYSKTEKVFGCNLNDPKPRMKGTLHLGQPFAVTPTQPLNPALGAPISSTKNLKNEC